MTIFDEMVAAFNPQNPTEKNNAQHEVMQRIALFPISMLGRCMH